MLRPGDCGLSLGHVSAQLEKGTSKCMEPTQAGVSSMSETTPSMESECL